MKSFNFKAQASLILTATLALTLFASHAAMAKGPKDSKSKQQQNSVNKCICITMIDVKHNSHISTSLLIQNSQPVPDSWPTLAWRPQCP